jgi:hypothetical protein
MVEDYLSFHITRQPRRTGKVRRTGLYTEIEFLDINLTRDSSLLLHAIHNPFYWRILKKTILYSGFNNPYKKSTKKQELESIHE